MDNLRLILIIVASLAFIALLIHGFWINKKERSNIFSTRNKSNKKNRNKGIDEPKLSLDDDHYDEMDGVGEVRVISSSPLRNNQTTEPVVQSLEKDEPEAIISGPVQCDLFAGNNDTSDTEDVVLETVVEPLNETTKPSEVPPSAEATTTQPAAESSKNDVLVLHVTGLNGDLIQGGSLLNSVLQSGFQFGEMQIFHRHVDPAGNGPVLFSLANMVKPGYLDPETMHDMVTPGISLFMMVPSFGDNQQNFKMMLQSAQRIADDVNGVVLDDEHHMITPQKIASYRERIKQVMGK